MGLANAGGTESHARARSGQRPHKWIMKAGGAATVAACVYVAVWSALLGSLAANLTVGQEVTTAIVALLSGGLIWVAVRALMLQEGLLTRQESMEVLEESRSFSRILMDNLPEAIWLKTLDHRYQAANLMWAQYNPARPTWTDRTLSHLLGHTDRELYEPDRAAEFEQSDDIVVATGRRWEHDYDEIYGDRHVRFHVIKIPVFDAWGSVVSIAGIGLDVTGQHKAEEGLEQIRDRVASFMDRSPEHACLLGVDRMIQFANVRICEFLGAYPSELLGKDAADYVAPSDRDRFIAFIKRVVAEGSAGYEDINVPNAAGKVKLLVVSGVLASTAKGPPLVVVLGRIASAGRQ